MRRDSDRDTRPRLVLGWLLAIVTVAAPVVASGWFALCPQYGNPSCPSSADPRGALDAFAAAPAGLLEAFLAVNMLAPYVVPLSIVGLAVVAWRTSPWLALIGAIAGWLGAIPWGFFSEAISLATSATRTGDDSGFTGVLETAYADWHLLVVATGWVLGHLIAYVLLGIALARAPDVPRWSGVALIVSAALIGPIAYGSGLGVVQVAGYLLIALASVPVAVVIVREAGTV
jgi:hypothetical protein